LNLRAGLLTLCCCLLQGCAQPTRAPEHAVAGNTHWSGRLALHIDSAAVTEDHAQQQSFSAAFELHGTPEQGTLALFSPLGNTLAQIHWQPEEAVVIQGEQQQRAPSLTALVQALAPEWSGNELPITALFAWLQGKAVATAGWQADVSALPQGRLTATRHTPQPQATLRVVLDTPPVPLLQGEKGLK